MLVGKDQGKSLLLNAEEYSRAWPQSSRGPDNLVGNHIISITRAGVVNDEPEPEAPSESFQHGTGSGLRKAP